MKKRFAYLVFIYLIVFSCKTIDIEDKKLYKKIKFKNVLSEGDNCPEKGKIYLDKKTKKKLDGKYRIKWKHHRKVYANFRNGIYNGKYLSNSKSSDRIISTTYTDGLINGLYEETYTTDSGNVWHTKSHFVKGRKYGVEEEFLNKKLYRKCNYINNMKIGKEYIFNLNNKDTLDILNYSYNKYSFKPSFSNFKFSRDEKKFLKEKGLLKELKSTYHYSLFKGTIILEGKNYYTNYSNFIGNYIFYFPTCEDDSSYIIRINNVYFLGLVDSMGLFLYELENKP